MTTNICFKHLFVTEDNYSFYFMPCRRQVLPGASLIDMTAALAQLSPLQIQYFLNFFVIEK